MRADARRNRDRVLDAADLVFSEHGLTASTEDVARRAGVGIGTVFRHFPTKGALLEAVFLRRLEWVAEHAESLAMSDTPDAFIGFLTQSVEQARSKSAVTDALAAAGGDLEKAKSVVQERMNRALATLLSRAQAASEVRADIGVAEVIALLIGVTRASEHTGWDPQVQARIIDVVVSGLRPN